LERLADDAFPLVQIPYLFPFFLFIVTCFDTSWLALEQELACVDASVASSYR
jgi:hypothetical protein